MRFLANTATASSSARCRSRMRASTAAETISLTRQASFTVSASHGVAAAVDVMSTPRVLATMAWYTASSPPSSLTARICSFSPRMTASTRCEGMFTSGSEKSK